MQFLRCFEVGLRAPIVLSLVVAGPIGCHAESPQESAAEPTSQLGRLELPLVTPMQGRYRLRDAVFEIRDRTGTSIATLDSEAAGDTELLTLDIPQGDYTVLLREGWSLELDDADGGAAAAHAALVTTNPQSFQIIHAQTTLLRYVFTTSEGTVSFGVGSLGISIEVTNTQGAVTCDLLNPVYTCGTGQTCLLADEQGSTFCAAAGSLPVGSPCAADECGVGSQCLKLDPADPSAGICASFCDPNNPPTGCDCASLSFSPNLGVCRPPAGTSGGGCQAACDPATEVSFNGGCYYLDGSGGACDPGYVLAPQSVLYFIGSGFVGKTYKHSASGNCCVLHADQAVELQDYGMSIDCNVSGAFSEGPVPGGAGCVNALNTDWNQLTLCVSASTSTPSSPSVDGGAFSCASVDGGLTLGASQ